MPVERSRERSLVLFGTPAENRVGGELRRDERFVDPVTGQRVDQPGRVTDEKHAFVRGARGGPRIGSRCPRTSLSASGSSPCARASRARCSRSLGPSSSQPPTPRLAWSPFGKTHPYPPGTTPSSTQAVPRYGSGSRSPHETLPSSATPGRIPAPSPVERATMPLAPSAPMTNEASIRDSPTVACALPASITISLTAAPSRKSAPAAVACSARYASSFRRWVMRITGVVLLRATRVR